MKLGRKSECSSKERQKRGLQAMLAYTTNCSSTLAGVKETTSSCDTSSATCAAPAAEQIYPCAPECAMEMFGDNSKVFILG